MIDSFFKKYRISICRGLCITLFICLYNSDTVSGQDNLDKLSADELFAQKKYSEAASSYYNDFTMHIKVENYTKGQEAFLKLLRCMYRLKQYEPTLDTLNTWIPILEHSPLSDNIALAKTYGWKGLVSKKLNQYNNAIKAYERSIFIFDSLNYNGPNLAHSCKNVAQLYLRKLDYGKTVSFLEKGLKSDSTQKHHASIYGQLAHNYFHLEEYEKALQYQQLGLSSKMKQNDKFVLTILAGAAHYKLGNLNEAKKYCLEALEYYEQIPSEWEKRLRLHITISEIYQQNGEHEKANRYLKKGLSEVRKYSTSKNREASRLYVAVGTHFLELSQYEQACIYFQKALVEVFPNFNSLNIDDNPNIEEAYPEPWIMTASALKGEALQVRYSNNGDLSDLKNAAECFDLSLAGINALKESYGTDKAKLYLGDYSHDYYEEAIETNHFLFEKTGDSKYLKKAFSIMEMAKASVLEEGIQKNRALILSNLPDSILSREQELRLSLVDLNRMIKNEELKEENSDADRISELRSQVVGQQREYEDLLSYMEEKFPEFKNYLNQKKTPSIKAIQKQLKKTGSGMLEYFFGEENIYLIAIFPDEVKMINLGKSNEKIKTLEEYVNYFKTSSAIPNDTKGYVDAAFNSYEILFPDEIQSILLEKLIIIPDGALNFIPFDALITRKSENTDLTDADYLIQKYQISFAYSASLHLRPEPEKQKRKILAFAPLFLNNERGLAPLKYSESEIDRLKKVKIFQSNEASITNFRKWAPQGHLIHLSTHAGLSKNWDEAQIEFIDTSLTLSELYALKIPAGLVVLSACETGLGKYEKGEGVMSLARGFAYAGSTNLAASLWKVNEKSTSDIINRFYKNIFNKKGKAEALRNAKLYYIKNVKSDAKKSPYYWAGFILIGNDEPFYTSTLLIPLWVWFTLTAGVIAQFTVLKIKEMKFQSSSNNS